MSHIFIISVKRTRSERACMCETHAGRMRSRVRRSIRTKKGLYPDGPTGGMVLRGPEAGGSTGREEEKIPRAFRFKPGIRLLCCWGETRHTTQTMTTTNR